MRRKVREALRKAEQVRSDLGYTEPPEDCFTVPEYARQYGYSLDVAWSEVKHLEALGALERVGAFKSRRAVRRMVYYRAAKRFRGNKR